jgi:lysine-N-methylase
MASPLVQLPLIQNWSCHSCGGCCRKHLIEITEEDRQRIAEQKWSPADGIGNDGPPVVWHAGPPWKKRYRLAHRADGSCVFLNEQGLCRIHAKFGEAAKPLACQVYPYALHPGGRKLALSLRFSCPSVVANKGRPVSLQVRDLKRIADLTVPPTADKIPPPEISPGVRVDWTEFHRFVDALDATLAEPGVDLLTRLLRAVFWVRLVGQSKFDVIRGNRLDEYLQIVTEAARNGIGEVPAVPREASRAGRLQFRMLAAQYSRVDTFEKAARGLGGRVRLLRAALRFARGRGDVPPLHPGFHAVPFSRLEDRFGGLNSEADAILTRYFRVKIQGLHFCGAAYYWVPFVEGFYSLALVFPVVLWQARWLAASESRDQISTDDVARVLAITDHHHGYSPVLGTRSSRRRVRLLAHGDDLERLCRWYAR